MRILSPYAPHVGEELWERLGFQATDGDLAYADWPAWDPDALAAELVDIVVQVGGKGRARLQVPPDMDKDALEALAMGDPGVQKHVAGKTVRKVIVVPGRLVSIVAN